MWLIVPIMDTLVDNAHTVLKLVWMLFIDFHKCSTVHDGCTHRSIHGDAYMTSRGTVTYDIYTR